MVTILKTLVPCGEAANQVELPIDLIRRGLDAAYDVIEFRLLTARR